MKYKNICCAIFLLASSMGWSDDFGDDFSSGDYGGDLGNGFTWSSDWDENDNNSSSSGDIRITGGELRLQDNDREITRGVDLSAYTSATISFDYRETSFDNNNDNVSLQIRTGGSGSWQTLETFAGNFGSGSLNNRDITAYLASDTEIRFSTSSNNQMGNGDDFFVDNLIISALPNSGSGPSPVGCSPYAGLTTINEVHRENSNDTPDAGDFVEIKVFDGNIDVNVYQDWTITLRNGDTDQMLSFGFDDAAIDDTGLPWILLSGTTVGQYLNISKNEGMEVLLEDADGLPIDYLSVEGQTDLKTYTNCDLPFDIDFDVSGGGSSVKSIYRKPDGVGDWDYENSGSFPGSPGDTNDGLPDDAPELTVDDIVFNEGGSGTFTLTLDALAFTKQGNAVTYIDSPVNYVTIDGTATQGNEYNYKTGQVTINANELTTTIDVDSIGLTGTGYFYVILSHVYSGDDLLTQVKITDPVGQATILPVALVEYRFDESSWAGLDDEVLDNTGNGYEAKSVNGADTANAFPAVVGSPGTGTCGYGEFDGDNDYVELPSSFPNLTDDFTITAWIYAEDIGNDQRIFADDESDTGGFAFSLGDGGDGQLRFFSRSVSSGIVDTQSAVITVGQWYFITAVHDATAKTQQIYVNAVAQILNTGTTTSTYTGTWGTDSGTASIGGETNASSEGTPRWAFDGRIDEVRVYESALSASEIADVYVETHACSLIIGPDHFAIDHDGSAIYCANEPITVTAENADGSAYVDYDGTITLDALSGIGTWSINSGFGGIDNGADTNNGVATYAYSTTGGADDNGVATFNLYHGDTDTTVPVSLNISVFDGLVTDDGTAGPLVFSESGFSITGSELFAGTDPLTIPVSTQTAGTEFSVFITAFGTTPSDPVCGIIEAYNGLKTINLTHGYDNPGSGTINPTFKTTAGADFISGGSATFVSGQLELIEKYKDVGSINLVVDDGVITGDSDNFVVKPAGFLIAPEGNPNASNSAGPIYNDGVKDIVSGETFAVDVTAIDSDGDATPNYGLEDIPETIILSHVLQDPIPGAGNAGVLTGNLSFTTNVPSYGLFEGDFNWNEVGIITLIAAVEGGDYLDIGNTETDTAITNRTNVGRFKPAYFLVEPDVVTGLINRTDLATQVDCGDDFTFIDEELTLDIDITAKEKNGGTTENYEGDYAKLDNVNSLGDITGRLPNALNVIAGDGLGAVFTPALRLGGTLPVPDIEMIKGVDEDVSVIVEILRKTSSGAFEAETPLLATKFALNPIDSDDVESNGTETIDANEFTLIGTTDLYYGRIVVENTSGSELIDLPVWSHTEYCNAIDATGDPDTCTAWVDLNRYENPVVDSCSQLALASVPADLSYQGGWNGDVNYSGLVSAPFLFQDFDVLQERGGGGFLLRYTAGGDGGVYTLPVVTLPTTVEDYHPYLLLQQGQITFGSYRGHDKIIYWREQE